MYIVIDELNKSLPKIVLKVDRSSNVIKKKDIKYYKNTKKLLNDMFVRISEYQNILNDEIKLLIKKKEEELNIHNEEIIKKQKEKLKEIQSDWYEKASKELNFFLIKKKEEFENLKKNIQRKTLLNIKNNLDGLITNEKLVSCLIDILHDEIKDNDKKLIVDYKEEGENNILTIEDDNQIITFNINDLINQIKNRLEDHD